MRKLMLLVAALPMLAAMPPYTGAYKGSTPVTAIYRGGELCWMGAPAPQGVPFYYPFGPSDAYYMYVTDYRYSSVPSQFNAVSGYFEVTGDPTTVLHIIGEDYSGQGGDWADMSPFTDIDYYVVYTYAPQGEGVPFYYPFGPSDAYYMYVYDYDWNIVPSQFNAVSGYFEVTGDPTTVLQIIGEDYSGQGGDWADMSPFTNIDWYTVDSYY